MSYKRLISVAFALFISQLVAPYVLNFMHGTREHGPDSNIVKKHIYQGHGGGCYKMKPVAHICPLHSQGN